MTKSSDTAAEKSAFKSEKQNRAARDSQEVTATGEPEKPLPVRRAK